MHLRLILALPLVLLGLTALPGAASAAETASATAPDLDAQIAAATVNIVCDADPDSNVHSTSGSGVIISPSGIILTNAHVAQFLLLEEKLGENTVACIVRGGDPARPLYTAKLLYISPTWIEKNAGNLESIDPTGTGENDFALLTVTGSLHGTSTPPTAFPYLSPRTKNLSAQETADEDIELAGYPAEYLRHATINTLIPYQTASTQVADLYTFNDTASTSDRTIDVISVSGTDLSQKGSSGGPVVDQNGNLLGIIVTSTDEKKLDDRTLRAITVPYINRTLQSESGIDLSIMTASSTIAARSQLFNTTLSPILGTLLSLGLNT